MTIATRAEVLDILLDHREEAVANFEPTAIPVYSFLASRFRSSSDLSSDYLFQFVYRSYYRLDTAGLGNNFKTEYFRILQEAKPPKPAPNLRQLCKALAEFGTIRHKSSLQFSFATKLLATVDSTQPVYDSYVASVFQAGTAPWSRR